MIEIINQQGEFEWVDRRQIRVRCECGANVLKKSISSHRRTAKHVRYAVEHFQRDYQERIRVLEETNRLQHEKELEQKKKEEEERVSKRGLPTHIADIVFRAISADCVICYESLTRNTVFLTKCGHVMCKGCEKKLYDSKKSQCPECRKEF
jgi:hypothetical protein